MKNITFISSSYPQKTIHKSFLVATLFLLGVLVSSGCSTYESTFDCPIGEGVRCASLSTINRKMDQGEIDIQEESPALKNISKNPIYYISPGLREQLKR